MRKLSDIIKLDKPPTIGYLTMSCDPEHLDNVIIDCIHQEYFDSKGRQRDDLKRMYITYQRKKTWHCPYCKALAGPDDKYCCACGEAIKPIQVTGDFPAHLEFDPAAIPIAIKQINSEGDWPALWLWKFRDSLDAMAAEPNPPKILIVFDEDDRYYPDYTAAAVRMLLANTKSAAVWNHEMIFVTSAGFKLMHYNSAYGTMVGYRALIDQAIRKFVELHPDGLMKDVIEKKVPIGRVERRRMTPHRRRRKKYKVERVMRRVGPLDGPFRRFFCDEVGKKNVIEGNHKRYYFFTLGAATYVSGRHNDRKTQCVDND